MKRAAGLFEGLTSFRALCAAANRAGRGKRLSTEAMVFLLELEASVFELQGELRSERYVPGPFHHFSIRDPKPRLISAAPFRDRVVHHALCTAMAPRLEAYASDDSYACRLGRGQKRALARSQSFVRRFEYFAKLDVLHFFETADHSILSKQIRRLFKDRRTVRLAESFIRSDQGHGAPSKGLPIGNLTSQHFANLYLGPLDHYIRQELAVPGYVRYMDDMLLFGRDRGELQGQVEGVKAYLRTQLCLEPRDDAERFDRTQHGVPFLGFRIWAHLRRFDRARRRRFLRKLSATLGGVEPGGEEAAARSMASLCGWAEHAQTRGLLRAAMDP